MFYREILLFYKIWVFFWLVCIDVDFVGGGIATDESTQGLPLNAVDFDTLKPHLSFLLNIYGINYVRRDILWWMMIVFQHNLFWLYTKCTPERRYLNYESLFCVVG